LRRAPSRACERKIYFIEDALNENLHCFLAGLAISVAGLLKFYRAEHIEEE
jgi:hypothetical protein